MKYIRLAFNVALFVEVVIVLALISPVLFLLILPDLVKERR